MTDYLKEMGIKTRYLHSDIDTIERMKIIHDLRKENFMFSRNKLAKRRIGYTRSSLVTILDADKEGF